MAPKTTKVDETKISADLIAKLKKQQISLDDLTIKDVDGDGIDDKDVEKALKEHTAKVRKQLDSTKKTGDNAIEGFGKMKDSDNKGGKDLTNTSQQQMPSIPTSQGTPQQTPQSQPQQQMPTVQPVSAQPVSTQPTTTISPEQYQKLLSGAQKTLDERGTSAKDNPTSTSTTPGEKSKENTKGKLDPSEVRFVKTGEGVYRGAQLREVIDQALTNNGITDPAAREKWATVLEHQADKESSGNPDAINLNDSNATGEQVEDGSPQKCSRGIWQTIYTTFAAYHVEGTSENIYDPVASASAAVNYMMNDGKYSIGADGSGLDKFAADRGLDLSSGQVTGEYKGY